MPTAGVAVAFAAPSFAAPASAAAPNTIVEPPEPPKYNAVDPRFSGLYFGAGITYSQLSGDLSSYSADTEDAKDVFGSTNLTDSGFGANVEIGYDIQHANGFVFGVVADATISFDSLGGGGVGDVWSDPKDVGDIESEFFSEVTNTGSLLGRLGFTPNNHFLLYGLAGVTFAQWKSGGYIEVDGGLEGNWSDSGITHGYTLGTGLEAAFHDNFSLKFEYRYTYLQKITASGFVDSNGQGTNWFDGQMHQGMVKLIYRIPPSN